MRRDICVHFLALAPIPLVACSDFSVETAVAKSQTPAGAGDATGPGRCAWSRAFGDIKALAVDDRGATFIASSPTGATADEFVVQKLDPAGNVLWTFEPTASDAGKLAKVATGADGAIFIIVAQAARAPTEPVAGRHPRALRLLKLAADGNLLGSDVFQADGNAREIAVANTGDVVAVGRGRDTNFGYSWEFVAHRDADRHEVWQRNYPYLDDVTRVYGAAFDGAGNVVVGGRLADTLDFGGGPLAAVDRDPSEVPNVDAFVVKYSATGDHLWSKRFGDRSYQAIVQVAADAAGNVVAVAQNQGIIDFGGGPISSPMRLSRGSVLGTFDPDGRHLWSSALPDGMRFSGLDATGAVVLSGTSRSSIDLGTGAIVSVASTESGEHFVARLSLRGRPLTSARWGVDGAFRTFGPHDELVLSGQLTSAIDFGCGVLQPAPNANTFVVVLAPP